jgi:protein tyrosine/serine phosphatase
MGIGLVCDLRLADERVSHPNRVDPETEARTHHFDIMPGSADGFRDEIMRGVLAPESARRFMLEIYRADGPVLIHCAAGKDRTGWGVALFQLALGVPQDEIRAGYLLSAERFPIELEIEASQRDWREKGAPPVSAEALAPLYGIDVAYLDAALEEAEKVAGSLESYLREVLRLTPELREALEERFLERD